MQPKDKGEGSYSGTRDYNERTKKFMEEGKVRDAAQHAAPASQEEAHRMKKAEREAKKRAKGEDPALHDPSQIQDDPDFPRK